MPIAQTTITGPILDANGIAYANAILRFTPAAVIGDDSADTVIAQTSVDVATDAVDGDFSIGLVPSELVPYSVALVVSTAQTRDVNYTIGRIFVPDTGTASLQDLLPLFDPDTPTNEELLAALSAAVAAAESAAGGAFADAAEASAVASATSETNSAISETNSAISETNSAISETNAATSETNAAALAGAVMELQYTSDRGEGAALADIADSRAGSTFFLSSLFGDDSNLGHSGMQSRASVDGLTPRVELINADFSKTAGFANVYEYEIDKGSNYHRDSEIAIFSVLAASRTTFSPVKSIADCDAIPGSYFDGSLGARFTTVYVHGVSSDVLSASSTRYIAEQSCPSDAKIGIAAGSVFKGARTLEPARGYARIGAVGRGALPEFDCTVVISEGDFTASDHPAATSNVYECAVTNEPDTQYLNDPEHQVWQTDASGERYSLETVNSVAECAARAGSVYFGGVGDEDVSARSGRGDAIAFVHPRFSLDATDQSGGEIYEFAYSKSAISIHSVNGVDDRTNVSQGTLIEGVIARGQVDGQGSIVTNEDAVVRRALLMDGNKHAFVGVTGRLEDVVFYASKPDPIAGPIPATFYRPDATGLDAEYRRVIFIKPDHQRGGASGLITHGSGGTTPDRHHLNQVVLYNGGTIGLSGLREAVCHDALIISGGVENTYATKADMDAAAAVTTPEDRQVATVTSFDAGNNGAYVWNAAIATPAYEPTSTLGGSIQAAVPTATKPDVHTDIRRALFDSTNVIQSISAPSAGATASDLASLSIKHSGFCQRQAYGAAAILLGVDDMGVTIKNNTFVYQTGGYTKIVSSGHDWGAGRVATHNIVLDMRPNTGGYQEIARIRTDGGAVAGVWDYNVYCIAGGALAVMYVDNTAYRIDTPAGWASYQAAVASIGVDQNSVCLFGADWSELFVADPRDGNYLLKTGTLTTIAGDPIEFGDGSPVNTTAGIQEYLDWRSGAILDGQPQELPRPPKTEAECREYVNSPWTWSWYS